MSVPATIHELCERFERDEKRYKQDSYNEAQLRQDFLNPLFKELGWDVYHEQRATLSHREVKVEVPIKMGNEHGFLDYAFCVDGRVKFVVEAKKPWVSVETHLEAAKQVRRYGWNQKLGLSILTNFREFAIYDCTAKPGMKDTAKEFRLKYFSYQELRQAETWKWLSDRFSRSSVLGGFLDEFAAKKSGKRGSAQVDETLLQEIDGWRTELAANIYKRNEGIDVDELNYIIGKIIDRIIFLRVCEDRGIEPYETLLNLVQKGGVYPRLVEYFYKADERYNSGLFHFKDDPKRGEYPDLTTPQLTVDDVVLQGIIRGLYYPKSQFLFSEIPIEILGHVYEQFLGKVIALKGGGKRKSVEVDFKPEVRKAGGVYYTPTYIVDYIVKHTVGKLVEGKTPGEVSKLRVLDPACGSGSFLIGAYQFLLDWHLSKYVGAGPLTRPSASVIAGLETHNGERKKRGAERGLSAVLEKHEAVPRRNLPIHETSSGWKLTLEERKRILLNNIYGVDIDAQAVEVTKLSLLLKVLEGATEAEIKEELAHKHHALPDLGKNIKCGNSLVGTDILTPPNPPSLRSGQAPAKARGDMSEDELKRINPFDWKTEFKAIFKQGGFDAVIGNPPYVRQESLGWQFKNYAKEKFAVYSGIADLYTYFIEQSHRLLNQAGRFGMIVSNKWMRADYGAPLREFISKNTKISQLVDFGELKVFREAATFPIVVLTENTEGAEQKFVYAPIKRLNFVSLVEEVKNIGLDLDNRALQGYNWSLTNSGEQGIIEKMKAVGVPLGKYVDQQIFYGIKTGYNQAFVIDGETRKALIKADKKSAKFIKPFVIGDDVRKYHIRKFDRYIIVIPKGTTAESCEKESDPWKWFSSTYPALAAHLKKHQTKASARQDQGDFWWELRACDYYDAFEKPKIVYPEIAKESRFAMDRDALYSNKTTFIIPLDDPYLLGVLNSRAMWAVMKRLCSVLGDADKSGRLLQQKIYIEQLPIRVINFKDKADKARHDKMVKLVERMLELNKKLPEAKNPNERTKLERQIAATDREIDELVYELYGLTEDEIAIVEGTEQR